MGLYTGSLPVSHVDFDFRVFGIGGIGFGVLFFLFHSVMTCSMYST